MGDPEVFLREHLGIGPLLRRSTGSFDDLLSLSDVDGILTGRGLRRPALRLVRDGRPVAPAAYTRAQRTGSVSVADAVDPGRVLAEFDRGATVVLQGLQRWWPPLTELCRGLELDLGHRVQVNAYLTPAGAAGLAPHHDTHDVFVLQVAGRKHWELREPLVDRPLPRHRSDHRQSAARAVTDRLDLGPGDALYLPRGHIHSAATQDGPSLHLTVGVLGTTVHDVLRLVVDQAGDDPRFRSLLPVGHALDPQATADVVKAALVDLSDWLAEVDPAQVAERLATRFVADRRPALGGQLLELTALADLDDRTVVVRRPGALWRLTTAAAPGRSQLVLGDRRLDLPSTLDPAVSRLLDGTPRTVGSLSDLLDGPSRVVLARRLVREAILVTRRSDG